MCGIAGILSLNYDLNPTALENIARTMADALRTRGPDDRGVWVDAAHGIALSHRRLSIIDLSPEGHQPMISASGRYVVSFNGEIYNYQDLRKRLDYLWRGKSDTEVLLAAIEAWGVEKALPELNGMFAFALWDKETQTLTLARDRMGEKPLYYGNVKNNFLFASELKAFRSLPGWPPAISREALTLFMRYSYVPTPYSIYEGIYKLKPGHFLSLKAGEALLTPKPYWSYEALVQKNIAQRFSGDEKTAIDHLESKLKFAVKQRMVSDVPLGAFLSGGIDSSTIVALMQAQSSDKIRTFTIGFKEQGFDEAPYAKAVANHLGTEHTEIYLSPREIEEVIPHLPEIYDEPFADSSQVPTYLVSRFARQHVTVALSGDGGDECFGGYNRYVQGPPIWQSLSFVPLPLRKLAVSLLPASGGKIRNYLEKIDASSKYAFYQLLCSRCNHPEQFVLGGSEPSPSYSHRFSNLPYAEWMMAQDALTYFPDDIMAKVDRAAMAVSLETRTPFTDPEIMAFAWQLPLQMKIRARKGKWLLRQLLYRYVPESLIERPKAGFAMPAALWLRGPLKSWADDLLAPARLRQQGYFEAEALSTLWEDHQSSRRDHSEILWNVLMFQSWLDAPKT